jgi:hypothetical protein
VIARVGGAAVTVQELNVMYGLSIQLDVRRYPGRRFAGALVTVRRLDGAAP